jgi:hypothetical protein
MTRIKRQTQSGVLLAYHSHTLTRYNPAGKGRTKTTLGMLQMPSSNSTAARRYPRAVRAPAADQQQQRKTSRWLYLACNRLRPSCSRTALQCRRRNATAANMKPGAPKTNTPPHIQCFISKQIHNTAGGQAGHPPLSVLQCIPPRRNPNLGP